MTRTKELLQINAVCNEKSNIIFPCENIFRIVIKEGNTFNIGTNHLSDDVVTLLNIGLVRNEEYRSDIWWSMR